MAGYCVACPCAVLSSSCRNPSPTPSNAVKRCCSHRTPPPPPPLNALSIVHHCHSCRPSPPPNTNAHLRPSPLSNADARRHHPPPLMSISIVASSSPIRIPHRRCRQTLPPPLNAPPSTTIERRRLQPLLLSNSPSSIAEERGISTTTPSVPTANGSTIVRTFTSPDNWTYLNFLQYLKFSDYQLVSIKNTVLFS